MCRPMMRRERCAGSGLRTSACAGLARNSRPSMTRPQIALPQVSIATLPSCLGVFQTPSITEVPCARAGPASDAEMSAAEARRMLGRCIGSSHGLFGLRDKAVIVDVPRMKARPVVGEVVPPDAAEHPGLHKEKMKQPEPRSRTIDAVGAEKERNGAHQHVE